MPSRLATAVLVLGLWVPSQALSELGLTGLSDHDHIASVSPSGDLVLHHHDDIEIALEHGHLDLGTERGVIGSHEGSHDDHVIAAFDPVRFSPSNHTVGQSFAAP